MSGPSWRIDDCDEHRGDAETEGQDEEVRKVVLQSLMRKGLVPRPIDPNAPKPTSLTISVEVYCNLSTHTHTHTRTHTHTHTSHDMMRKGLVLHPSAQLCLNLPHSQHLSRSTLMQAHVHIHAHAHAHTHTHTHTYTHTHTSRVFVCIDTYTCHVYVYILSRL